MQEVVEEDLGHVVEHQEDLEEEDLVEVILAEQQDQGQLTLEEVVEQEEY